MPWPVVTEPLARFSSSAGAAAVLHVTCTHNGNFAFSPVVHITISIHLYGTFNNTNGFTDNRKLKGQGKEIVPSNPSQQKYCRKKGSKTLVHDDIYSLSLNVLKASICLSCCATASSHRYSLSMKSASRPV